MTAPRTTLLALMLVTCVLGSVHAFSVLIVSLETQLRLPRVDISLIYSLALVALTTAVLLGYRIYTRWPAWLLLLVTCTLAAAGLLLASAAKTWWQLFAGYSLVFGFCNGIGYGYCLQLGGQAMPRRRGFAMGAVTASYAVGSILFAQVFAWRIETDSVRAALLTLAIVLFAAGLLAAALLRPAMARYSAMAGNGGAAAVVLGARRILQFWLAYLAAVFSGLMAIGHAAGIALAAGAGTALATLAASAIGIGSAFGGFAAGWLVDRWPLKRLLVGLPLLSTAALLIISRPLEAAVVVMLLSLVGFSYGAIIAIYPVAIARHFGARGAEAYGRVFTAWGLAGLLAPWSAGLIYDWRAGYETAMLIAAVIALGSAIAAACFGLEKTG